MVVLGFNAFNQRSKNKVGGNNFSYTSPTMATSSVTTSAWSSVLSSDTSRNYASLCNSSNVIGSAIFLGFDATSTPPYGIIVPPQQCYNIGSENMFFGTIYAIASTSTSTLLKLYK
jgi:hypothetical protein